MTVFRVEIETRSFRAALHLGEINVNDAWMANLISSAEQKTRQVAAEREKDAQRMRDLAERWPRYVEDLTADVKRSVDAWNHAATEKRLPVTLQYAEMPNGLLVSSSALSVAVAFDEGAHGLTVTRSGEQQSTRYEVVSNGARLSLYKWDPKGHQGVAIDYPAEMILKPLVDASVEAALGESLAATTLPAALPSPVSSNEAPPQTDEM
ncbi:MAG: hypothetical protein ACXW5U_22975 [Thermoanaerobaculia bacterium]